MAQLALRAAGVLHLAAAALPAFAQVTFRDETASAGVAVHHAGPPTEFHAMLGGAAAGDFDRDGWTDLFVLGGGVEPDALFINRRDGTFEDRAARWGVADRHVGSGCAVGDFDGDGWLDVFVTSLGDMDAQDVGKHRLYRNVDGKRFEDVAAAAGVNRTSPSIPDGFGAAFGDYDLDGDLDLFVTGWIGFPVSSEGNRLFRNEGDGTFVDVTVEAGIDPGGFMGFSPCFADMDGDRYPELLCTGDGYTSQYFVNARDGTFRPFTAESGTGLDHNGMGQCVADLNGDGRLDWYVTSIYKFPAPFGFLGEGNKYYVNVGGHFYDERAKETSTDDGGWGWSAVATDFDHDGWIDLVETNGFVPRGFYAPARVWRNEGDGTFHDLGAASGIDHDLDGRGAFTLDYDNDGDDDVAITANNGGFRLYRNDVSGPDAHWLRLRFDTSARPGLAPDGFGTRVHAVVATGARVSVGTEGAAGTSTRTLMRYLDGGSHYNSQSELSLHFGLGSATAVRELRITWADGSRTTMRDVPADRILTVAAPPAGP